MAGGRPKKFKPEYLRIAEAMAKVGCTETEIAKALGVNYSTFWRWKTENPQFCKAVYVGRDAANKRVETSLFHRAVGTTRKVQKVASFQGVHEVVEVEEEIPADVNAARFWLANQSRKKWQFSPEDDQGDKAPPMNIVIQVNDASNKPDDDEDL